MTSALYLLGVLAVAIGVGVSIALHEVGHMWPAKRFGVKVTQYMVGFGPTVWSRRRGETEYGIKAIPLGGYVRMIGMFPPENPNDESLVRSASTGRFSLMISDARQQSLEEVTEADRNRVFWKLPVAKRLVIMLGGPVMNLLIAIVLFAITFMGIGVASATNSVDQVLACMPTAANPSGVASVDGGCGTGQATGATLIGLKSGDQLVAVNGVRSTQWADLSAEIRASGGENASITFVRDGQEITRTLVVPVRDLQLTDDNGEPTGQVQQVGFIGVGPALAYQRQSFGYVVSTMWDITVRSARAVVTMPVRVYELAVDTFTGAGRDLNSPVSVIGVADIGGTVASTTEEPLVGRIAFILSMLAGLNLFLFLFNLLPILPLDGGHVAGALWEGTRRRIAALRGRPDPGPVDVAKALPVAYAVTMVLIAISSIVILADIINPISL